MFSTCPNAPAHEGEGQEKKSRVATCEWTYAGGLTVDG